MQKQLSTLMRLGICFGVISIPLLVGLWPLNFSAKNDIQWATDGSGINFGGKNERKDCKGGGILKSSGPLIRKRKETIDGAGVTIELWLKPTCQPKGCRSRILSFQDSVGKEVFFIGQWRSHMLVRGILRRVGGRRVFREIGADGVMENGKSMFITICSGNSGTVFYVDGEKVASYSKICLFETNNDLSTLYVSLGNNRRATGSWSGVVFGLAFYSGILSPKQIKDRIRWWRDGDKAPVLNKNILALYRFNEGRGNLCRSAVPGGADFLISDKFPLKKQLLKTSNPLDHPIKDLMINFFGFVPIGFIFCMLLKCRKGKPVSATAAAAIAVAAAMVLSFCIEWAQVYLPTRDSSLTDLSINTAGAIAGAVLCAWRCKRLPFIRC